MSSNTPTTIAINGFAMRQIRILSGLGVRQLADEVGKDRSYIAKIELGHSLRVSPAVYNDLLTALRIEDRRVLLAAPHELEVAS